MFIWLSDRSKNHSLPHHSHGADKEGGQHRGIIYVVSEGWDGDSHKGHCGVKEIVEAYFTSEQDVLFSTYWHLRTEKGKNSLFFTSWLKKPTANQMACIAFFTFGEKMKSLSIWYLHTCQFVSESNSFDFWFHHLVHKYQRGKLHMNYSIPITWWVFWICEVRILACQVQWSLKYLKE